MDTWSLKVMNTLGQLKLKICAEERKLSVTAFEIHGLLERRDVQTFVHITISLSPDFPQRERYKSKNVPVTANPAIFNETFTFNVPETETNRRVLISVWQTFEGNHGSGFAGCMSFSATKMMHQNKVIYGWYQLLGEGLGKRKHLAAKMHTVNGIKGSDQNMIPSRFGNIQPVKVSEDRDKGYFAIERSRKVSFQLEPQFQRASLHETGKIARPDHNRKLVRPRTSAPSMRGYQSESARSDSNWRQQLNKKSFIGRSPIRPKWRKHKLASFESPKFVTDARIVKSYRTKSAKIISRRQQQLRLRGNCPDIKVLYTDETECATQIAQHKASAPICEETKSKNVKDTDECIDKTKENPTKDQETGYITISEKQEVAKPTMTSGPQATSDDQSGIGPSLDHLTLTKSGRIKERRHTSRSPVFPRANDTSKQSSQDDVAYPDKNRATAPTLESSTEREHIYATITEMRLALASNKRESNSESQKTEMKSPVRRCKSSIDDKTIKDINMNLTPNRKRYSNTDSGISIQSQATEAGTRGTEICTKKEDNLKVPKFQTKNEKENNQPPSSTGDEDVPHILPKSTTIAASAKRTFAKKSFRQSKKLSTSDQSKTNEFSFTELLKSKAAVAAFHDFLKSEYSDENLGFWLDCESYKSVKESKRLKTAVTIYSQYLAASAPREVNIDSAIRTKTQERLKNPNKETFVEAQDYIFNLMKSDSFRRFLASPKYKSLSTSESHDPFTFIMKRASSRRK